MSDSSQAQNRFLLDHAFCRLKTAFRADSDREFSEAAKNSA